MAARPSGRFPMCTHACRGGDARGHCMKLEPNEIAAPAERSAFAQAYKSGNSSYDTPCTDCYNTDGERQEPGNEQHLCGDAFAGSREGALVLPTSQKMAVSCSTTVGRVRLVVAITDIMPDRSRARHSRLSLGTPLEPLPRGATSPLVRPPAFIHPCISVLKSSPPSGPTWMHEIKFA